MLIVWVNIMVVDETSSWQNDIAPVHYQNEKKIQNSLILFEKCGK
jgi:hypothetical protein